MRATATGDGLYTPRGALRIQRRPAVFFRLLSSS